jgi:hypothetical protein
MKQRTGGEDMTEGPDPGHMLRFCREILPGMLVEACGAAAPDASRVAKDILLRAEAAARLDPASCEILAAPFFEESFSHEPDEAPAWMKAITTLVIRNSQLEDLHANGPVNPEASPPSRPTGWARYPTSSQPGDGALSRAAPRMTRSRDWLTHTHVPGPASTRCGPR